MNKARDWAKQRNQIHMDTPFGHYENETKPVMQRTGYGRRTEKTNRTIQIAPSMIARSARIIAVSYACRIEGE
jgi:hypothetical protein